MTFLNETNLPPEKLMTSNGKIYVVIVCGLIILLGITSYLIYLDKKYSSSKLK